MPGLTWRDNGHKALMPVITAATTSQTITGNLVEDTLQSPGALTGRRVPLYERSGEGERASASGLVALAQSGGEDAGPARPDGDES